MNCKLCFPNPETLNTNEASYEIGAEIAHSILEEVKTAFGEEACGRLQSAKLLQRMGNAHLSGHAAQITRDIMNTMPKLKAPLPVTQHDIGLPATHPVILPSDYVRTLVEQRRLPNLLGGNGMDCLSEFWENFRSIRPEHPCFALTAAERNATIPVFLLADEGRSSKKSQIMIMGWEPVIRYGCEAEDDQTSRERIKSNFRGSTYKTRMLFSVLPSLSYQKDKQPLHNLVDVFASDLARCFTHGVRASGLVVRLAVLHLKADLPAHTKLGLLTRHFLRESFPSGHGMCHMCLANTAGCPTWHEHCFDTAPWVGTILQGPFPWAPDAESSLTSKIPMEPDFKPRFFHFDIFHTVLKGVGADLAGSAIVSWSILQQCFLVWITQLCKFIPDSIYTI